MSEDKVEELTVAEIVNGAVEDTTEQVEAVVEMPVEAVVEMPVEAVVELVADNKIDIINYVNRIAELEAELTQLKEVENTRIASEKEKAGVELVSNAISVGKIKAEAKADWLTIAVNNYTLAKSTLDALVVNKTGIDIKNLLNKESVKPKMGLREMEMKDPKQVENIYYNDRATYNEMYCDQYGVMPK